jgi:dTDP-4-dehydrorhamnose 3,5-epimerase-like enzyme
VTGRAKLSYEMIIMRKSGIEPQLINLPKIEDPRGNLSFIEEESHIPFKIRRVYWIYDVPGGEQRGGHAFKVQQEFVVALSGSFDIIIKDGKKEDRHHLNRSYFGLYIPNGLWRHMENFSTNTVVMVLASTLFNEEDYIRNFNDYLKLFANGKHRI